MSAQKHPLASCLAALAVMVSPALAQFDLPPDPGERAAGQEGTHEIAGCFVGLVKKIDLAAPEAGILTYVGIEQGSRFKSEEVLAKIDTREAEMGYKRAGYEWKLAHKRSQDKIEEEYARAQLLVEGADVQGAIEANQRSPGAVPAQDLRREQLEADRAELGIEKAVKDRELASLEADVKRVEMEASMIAIEKRQVRAEFNGEVLRLNREQGEWVQPGDVIAEIAKFDTLQVEGFVYYREFSPSEIENCRVTIDVRVGHDRIEQASGFITYINPIAENDGQEFRFRVRAEIANRQENGLWLINPGLKATMKIHLGTADATAVRNRPTRKSQAK